MSANEKVLTALQNAQKPFKKGEIAEIAGIDKKEVDKAINALKKDGKIVSPKRCYYAPGD